MRGNKMAEIRQRERECIDAQIMAESGKATGRVNAKITDVSEQLPMGIAPDLLSCCNVIRQIGLVQAEMLRDLVLISRSLGKLISTEAIDNLLIPTRDSKMFVIPGSATPAPVASGGTFTTVCSLQVPEGYMGILNQVGMQVNPFGAFPDAQFQICSSSDPDPYFSPDARFNASTLATPLQYYKVFPPQRIMQLRVLNTSPGAIDVYGLIMGYFRPLSSLSVG